MFGICAKRLLNGEFRKIVCRKINTSNIKSGGAPAWVYRRGPLPAPAYIERRAEILGAIMWYWIIYHCITQYDHITGEFPYPEPSKWTDAELGIPPDDE